MFNWQRPEDVPFPKVWATFKGNLTPNGDSLEYTIQDITEDMYGDVLHHMSRYFLVREPLCSTAGILEDEVSKHEIIGYWADCLLQQMSVVCLVEDEGETKIAGVNILGVHTKEDEPWKVYESKQLDARVMFSGEVMKKLQKFYNAVMSTHDPFERHQVNEYMSSLGLSVSPVYNGDGVGMQLLASRDPLCKATGIKVTNSLFTAEPTHEMAAKAGFDYLLKQRYDEFPVDGEILFKRLAKKTFALMENCYF